MSHFRCLLTILWFWTNQIIWKELSFVDFRKLVESTKKIQVITRDVRNLLNKTLCIIYSTYWSLVRLHIADISFPTTKFQMFRKRTTTFLETSKITLRFNCRFKTLFAKENLFNCQSPWGIDFSENEWVFVLQPC